MGKWLRYDMKQQMGDVSGNDEDRSESEGESGN
jgi:hypothetical protein